MWNDRLWHSQFLPLCREQLCNQRTDQALQSDPSGTLRVVTRAAWTRDLQQCLCVTLRGALGVTFRVHVALLSPCRGVTGAMCCDSGALSSFVL